MPIRELERLQEVNRFLKLELSKDQELQEIVALAAAICGTPTALITLIDQDTQYVKFKQAFDFDTTARQYAFCSHVITQENVMVVPDALEDERFVDNPLVTGNPHIRFYAGAPLATKDGYNLGSLCVIDQTPGNLTLIQQQMLKALSKQVIQLMEFDASLKILKEQYVEARRSEIQMRSFFESSIDCHLLLGKDFEILAFNKAWDNYTRTAYSRTLEIGKEMGQFLHPDNLEFFYSDYKKALKGTAVFVQRKLRNANQELWRIIKYEPAFNAEGEIIGVSVNSTDVTAKVEQEETVMAQSESLKEIAWIQSHELRRPVASIMGLMQILKEEGHVSKIEELGLMEKVVEELDAKVKTIVGHADAAKHAK